MRARRPLGIIDSGVGGLTVLKEIRALLPFESICYIGDSAWCPYGPKPAAAIQQRVAALTDHLLEHHETKLIVIACNSATICAVEALRAAYPVPFTGMEPAVKPAAGLTKTGVIAVLATEASLAGERYHHLVSAHARELRVITQPCPEFVELVEAGVLEGPAVESAVEKYLSPLLAAGADVLVLGCTHYPFLRPAIERAAGPGVAVIDTGAAVARQVKRVLERDCLLAQEETAVSSTVQILTTGSAERLRELLPVLCPDLPASVTALPIPGRPW